MLDDLVTVEEEVVESEEKWVERVVVDVVMIAVDKVEVCVVVVIEVLYWPTQLILAFIKLVKKRIFF